jgi:Mg-chelatase subunit ChlD
LNEELTYQRTSTNYIQQKTPTEHGLTIFVIDLSMPGDVNRITSVRGAAATLLPKEKVSVIGCYRGGAEVKLAPTTSSIQSMRALSRLQRSVMGNLAAGIELAIQTAEEEIKKSGISTITVAILADGRAHGLRSGPSTCPPEDICDIELLLSASLLATKKSEYKQKDINLSTIVIDTEG